MRIIADNAADRAVITASPADNIVSPAQYLQTQYREEMARGFVGAPTVLTLAWSRPTPLSACVLYRSNLSNAATWRVQVFSDSAATAQIYDSGTVNASMLKALDQLEWGVDALGASFYDDWGYTIGVLWFTPVTGLSAKVTIDDPNNPLGLWQASRLFMGLYLETSRAPNEGAQMAWQETTTVARTEGGTLRSEAGESYRTLNLLLSLLQESDRRRLSEAFRSVGMRGDLFVSVFPTALDALTRDHHMQAKLVKLDPTVIAHYGLFNQTLTLEEV